MTDMDNDFNINNVGKRMPYNVPERFFQNLEDNVRKRAAEEPATVEMIPHRSSWTRRFILQAACLTLLALVGAGIYFHRQSQPVDMADVENAFSQLDEQDQEYLISLSQDDIFMNP
jgi:hypothetical protein